jgi:hypothetical protein
VSQEDDTDDTQSRADRLTDRRSRSRERTRSASAESDTSAEEDDNQTGHSGQTGTTGETNQTGQSTQSTQSGQTEQDSNSDDGEDTEWSQAGDENVKRENVALYMYLDPRLHDTVVDVFEDVRYHYRKAYDVELQKNRHVYPLVLEHGIEPVREMAESPAEVRDALDANPYTPVVPSEADADGGDPESHAT